MRVIVGARQSGKTVNLIKESSFTGAIILCQSKSESERIYGIAFNMGLAIPKPLTYDEACNERGTVRLQENGVLVDNLDIFLAYKLPHMKINSVAITGSAEVISRSGEK